MKKNCLLGFSVAHQGIYTNSLTIGWEPNCQGLGLMDTSTKKHVLVQDVWECRGGFNTHNSASYAPFLETERCHKDLLISQGVTARHMVRQGLRGSSYSPPGSWCSNITWGSGIHYFELFAFPSRRRLLSVQHTSLLSLGAGCLKRSLAERVTSHVLAWLRCLKTRWAPCRWLPLPYHRGRPLSPSAEPSFWSAE